MMLRNEPVRNTLPPSPHLGCAVGQDAPVEEIPHTLSQLNHAVGELENRASTLRDKFRPVMRDVQEKTADYPRTPTSTILGGELEDLEYRINRFISILDEIVAAAAI